LITRPEVNTYVFPNLLPNRIGLIRKLVGLHVIELELLDVDVEKEGLVEDWVQKLRTDTVDFFAAGGELHRTRPSTHSRVFVE
jgi:hypothetical protein